MTYPLIFGAIQGARRNANVSDLGRLGKIYRTDSIFVIARPEKVSEAKYFRKISTDFSKQGIKWNVITSLSNLVLKKCYFFSWNFWIFHKKKLFFDDFFFNLSFLPTFMFNLNRWGMKWKVVIVSIHFSQSKSEKVQKN